jgi:hypothetical protein
MYCISEAQIEYILNDIRRNGVEMEDLQLNLLDHVCCIIEQNLKDGDDFEGFYKNTIKQFYKKELREIEEETITILTFKNYYAMKKVMIISGAISAAAFITGSFFKIMVWPGSGGCFFLAIYLMGFLFLPLMLILKTKEEGPKQDKITLALGVLVGLSFCISVLGSWLHWPIARSGVFWYITIGFSLFAFIPTYFFMGIRKPETKVNTIVTSVLLVAITAWQFSMINLRPISPQIKMNAYVQNEQLLEKMRMQFKDTNKLASHINNICEQIKSMILEDAETLTDEKIQPKDVVNSNIVINEGSLGMEFYKDREGLALLTSLKDEIVKYNETVGLEGNKIPIEHSILSDVNKVFFYSNLFVLNSITQLQMSLIQNQRSLVAVK